MTSCENCKRIPSKDKCFYARMSDARAFTNWTPNCARVFSQFKENAFMSSYDQRQYFINNAEKLMEEDRQKLISCSCFLPSEKGTLLDEKDIQTCNKNYCSFNQKNADGLGMGRNVFG
jgi:hypothetical protein